MNISFIAEKLPGLPVTNAVLTSIVGSIVIILLALVLTRNLRATPNSKQNFAEWLADGFYNLVLGVTGGDRVKASKIFPIGATFFLFIVTNNWLGLIPGVGSIGFKEVLDGKELFVPIFRGANADLNMTLALAIFSVGAIQFYGVSALKLGYFKKFINFSSPINFFVGTLESISEFAKIISFSFRLFGNIFAGEVLLVVITALVPYIAPLPFYGLEMFVGLVQALVFSILSLVFINVATQHHES